MESVVKFFPRNPRIVELGEYQKKLARAPVMEEPPVAIQVGEMALRSQSNENVINMLDKLSFGHFPNFLLPKLQITCL